MLMYYVWICLRFYDGQLVFPTSIEPGNQTFLEQNVGPRSRRQFSLLFPPQIAD